MTKASKNSKNAAVLRCDICKTGLMGQDSFNSHVRGKKHEQKVAQQKYTNRNKVIADEEEALAARGSSQVRPQPVSKSAKAMQKAPTESTPGARSLATAGRSSYPAAPRSSGLAKTSIVGSRESGGRSDEKESRPSREAQKYDLGVNTGHTEQRNAHGDEFGRQSFRPHKPDAARVDPREHRSYRASDSTAVTTSTDTGFRGSGVAERSEAYRAQYDRRTASNRQNEDPRLAEESRLNRGRRYGEERHTLSTEMSSPGSFSTARTTSQGEFLVQPPHPSPLVPTSEAEMRSRSHEYRPLRDSSVMDASVQVSPNVGAQKSLGPSPDFQKNAFAPSDARGQGYPEHDLSLGDAHSRKGESSTLIDEPEYGGLPADPVDPSYLAMHGQNGQGRQDPAFVGQRDPLSARDRWLEEPMSVEEWRAMEDNFMEIGGDYALAFKILRESLLNPHVGIEEHDMDTCLEIFNRIPVSYQGGNLWSTEAVDAPRCTIFERGEQSVSSQEEVDALQRLGTLIRSHLDPFHRDTAEEVRLFEERSGDVREAEYQAMFDAKLEEANRQGGFVAGQTAIVLYNMSIGHHIPSNLFHPKSVVCDPTFLALQSPAVKEVIINKISRSR
jgi:hypothetical protein